MGEKIKEILGLLKRGLLEIIYPKYDKCLVCDKEDEDGLCHNCKNSITYCKEDELCIGYYRGALKELILKFKFKKRFDAGDELIRLIENKLIMVEKDYYVTFIPIGGDSLKNRGFNQCEYLAKELCFRNGYKLMNTLIKVKETKVQKTLRKEERLKNLSGAFDVISKELIEGKKFLLIDDVITTGATLMEAEKVLRKNGAKEIKMLTLAKSNI